MLMKPTLKPTHWIAALWLLAAPVVAAEPVDDEARIATLKAQVQAAQNTVPVPLYLLRAGVELGQRLQKKGDVKGATAAWQAVVVGFQRSKFAATAPEAVPMAEASLALLVPEVDKAVQVKVVVKAALPEAKRAADVLAQVAAWRTVVLGPAGKDGVRAGGLRDKLVAVQALQATAAGYGAALQLGRLWPRLHEDLKALSADLPATPAEKEALEKALAEAREDEVRAVAAVEAAYRHAEGRGDKDSATVLRRELNRLRPKEFPLADGPVQQETISAQQQEASRLAGLAQQATKANLKVMYLQKAVKLDPANEAYPQLLKSAEAQLAAERAQ
jgi:hypothetical protein